MQLNLSVLIITISRITASAAACVFDLPFVPVTLFANDSSEVIPREVYLPLYGNSSDCLYRSRPNPIVPGISYLDTLCVQANIRPGNEFPQSIVQASLDTVRILNSTGLSLNAASIKSFLDFNSAVLGKPLNEPTAFSLVTCSVTTSDGVERKFKIGTDLALGGPLEVKSYQCFMSDKTGLI